MLSVVMLVVFLFAGLYCLYTAYRLSNATELFDNLLLYPGNCPKELCLDPQGFIAYMRPRIAVFGALCLPLCVYYAVEYYTVIPRAVEIIQYIFAAGLFIWGFWVYNRAAKRFW